MLQNNDSVLEEAFSESSKPKKSVGKTNAVTASGASPKGAAPKKTVIRETAQTDGLSDGKSRKSGADTSASASPPGDEPKKADFSSFSSARRRSEKSSEDGRSGADSVFSIGEKNPVFAVKKYNAPAIVVVAVMILYIISESLLSGNYINSSNPYVTVVIAQICVYLLPCAFFIALSSMKGGVSPKSYGLTRVPPKLFGFVTASIFVLVVGGMLIKYVGFHVFGVVSSGAISVSAGNDTLYVMLSSVIIPAITEEILFRGVLFGAYEKKLGGIGAILITSVLFALIHFDTVSFASYLYAGIILGICACVTHSVWASMLIHLLNNFICIFSDTYLQRISKESISTVFVVFILGVLLLAILFFYFESLELFCRERAISREEAESDSVGLYVYGEPRFYMLIRGFLAPAFLVSLAIYIVRILIS